MLVDTWKNEALSPAAQAALEEIRRPRPLGLYAKHVNHPRFGPIQAQAGKLDPRILEGTLVAAFEAMVAQQPDALALQDGAVALTYHELNARANRLARALVARWGPGTDEVAPPPIAILGEKGIASAIGLMAINKAGYSFMLLDATLGASEIVRHLRNTHACYLLALRGVYAEMADELAAQLPSCIDLVWLDDMVAETQTENAAAGKNLGLPIALTHPARMIFTSGSTGVPKYVHQDHQYRIYSQWEMAMSHWYSPADRHFTYYQFNANGFGQSLLVSLMSGGSVHFPGEAQNHPRELMQWLIQNMITHMYLPTIALRDLLEVLKGDNCLPDLRMIHVIGQTTHRSEVELFQQRVHPDCVLGCLYGMTEAGLIAQFQIDRTVELSTPTVPLGFPYPSRRVFIVDDAGQVLKAGEPGEVVVALALPGYWNCMPDLAWDFIDDPDAPGNQVPVFRTNDLGIWLPDGSVGYLGRKNDVVKVRGMLVSFTDVENALLQVPGVVQAAARTFVSARGDNRLVGYVVVAKDAPQARRPDYLRTQLQGKLGSYALPTRFVILDELPQTPSGKTDRKRLPPPENPRPEVKTPFRAPATSLEHMLCALWRELLELDAVGVDDDFFDLGGDSILLTGLMVELERRGYKSLPDAFYNEPTVARLAAGLPEQADSQAQAQNRAAPEKPTPTPEPPATGVNVVESVPPPPEPRGTLRHRIYKNLVETGPTWQALHLPYAVGVKAHQAFVRLPQLRRRHPRTLERVAIWRELMGDARPLEPLIVEHLLANTWRYWRLSALADQPAVFDRWVRVEGREHVQAALQQGRGVVLVTPHAQPCQVTTGLTEFHGRSWLGVHVGVGETPEEQTIVNHPKSQARRAQQLVEARKVLEAGGVVRIVGDGPAGTGGEPAFIGDRVLEIRHGAATLSVETGAPVLPVFGRIDVDGVITLRVSAPIPAASGGNGDGNAAALHQDAAARWARIESITRRYAQLYAQMWPWQYASMEAGFLAMYLGLPRATDFQPPRTHLPDRSPAEMKISA